MKLTKKKGLIALVLVAAIALMSFGFAAWSSTLTIDGTVSSNASWDLKIASVTLSDYDGVSTSDVIPNSTDVQSVTIPEIEVTLPGGWAQYAVEVKNAGTIDAKLTNGTSILNVENNGTEDFEVVYGVPSTDTIKAGESCVFTFVVKTTDNTTAATAAQELDIEGTFELTLEYEQAVSTSDAPSVSHSHK